MDFSKLTDEQHELANELHELIPLCGCGDPSASMVYVAGILQAIKARSDNQWDDASRERFASAMQLHDEHPAYWFVLYQLDHLGLLEHGSNVRGSWLTDKGKRALELYAQLEEKIKEGL
jgi:hypothetical protein